MLALPAPGYYAVHIEASLLDNDGRVWHTGHKESLSVLVNTEENMKQKTKENAPQRSGASGEKQSQRT